MLIFFLVCLFEINWVLDDYIRPISIFFQVFQDPRAMVRWDLQVLLANRVFLGSQDRPGSLVQRGAMGAVTLETV